MIALLIAAILFSAPPGDEAPPAAVSIEIAPDSVRIGDPVEVTLCIRALGVNSIRVERYAERSGDLVIQAPAGEEMEDLLGALVARRRFRVVPFSVGRHALPPLRIELVRSDGSPYVLQTPEIELNVVSVAPESGPTESKGLKGLLDRLRRESGPDLPTLALLAALVAGVALFAFLAWKRFLLERMPRTAAELARLSPAQRALRDLARLAKRLPLRREFSEAFHVELARIVRHYLALRFHVLAHEKTSAELAAAMRDHSPGAEEMVALLGSLLERCDLVKFARLRPAGSEPASYVDSGRRIVDLTRDDRESVGGAQARGGEQ